MSPLLMDTGYETNSPSSMSAEENHSNNAGSENEGEEQQGESRGMKRQMKNRDAARRSRRKQTERADELHEELQNLERSNSALRKEIASLKRDHHLYTKALESHEPFCILKASKSSSTIYLSVSPSANSQTSSSPLQASSSTPATTPTLSTPSTSTLDPQTLECVESSHISSSVPALTAASLDSATVFTPSFSKADPNSVTFSTDPPPHSLFSKTPPSLITPRLTKASSICTSLISSPVNSSSVTTPVHPKSEQGSIHESSSFSANSLFSAQPHFAPVASQMKQASLQSPFSNRVPTYSHFVSENTGQASQECPMNLPQLHQGNIKRNPVNPSLMYSLSSPALENPALQSLSVSPQVSQELPAASAFASELSYNQRITPNPMPLLSQLTNPSPLFATQTTSLSLEGQPLDFSLQNGGDLFVDSCLTELLEVDDWILQ